MQTYRNLKSKPFKSLKYLVTLLFFPFTSLVLKNIITVHKSQDVCDIKLNSTSIKYFNRIKKKTFYRIILSKHNVRMRLSDT